MRRNAFNDPYIQPGDDFDLIWEEHFGDAPDDVFSRLVEQDEESGTWGCEIADNDADRAVYVEGFATREALMEYLGELGIPNWD